MHARYRCTLWFSYNWRAGFDRLAELDGEIDLFMWLFYPMCFYLGLQWCHARLAWMILISPAEQQALSYLKRISWSGSFRSYWSHAHTRTHTHTHTAEGTLCNLNLRWLTPGSQIKDESISIKWGLWMLQLCLSEASAPPHTVQVCVCVCTVFPLNQTTQQKFIPRGIESKCKNKDKETTERELLCLPGGSERRMLFCSWPEVVQSVWLFNVSIKNQCFATCHALQSGVSGARQSSPPPTTPWREGGWGGVSTETPRTSC